MRRVVLAIVGTAAGLIVLLSFKTHSTSAAATPPAAISGSNSQTSAPAAPSASGSSSSSRRATSSSGSVVGAAKTATGTIADTMYGPVEVQITVKNGKVTAAQAVQYPQDSPRDQQINSYAIPVLNQEAVSAGSAQIDAVSGATYTSGGYVTSLQSALDKAGV
jgi:uncharacterized protein with FMN-binding domain